MPHPCRSRRGRPGSRSASSWVSSIRPILRRWIPVSQIEARIRPESGSAAQDRVARPPPFELNVHPDVRRDEGPVLEPCVLQDLPSLVLVLERKERLEQTEVDLDGLVHPHRADEAGAALQDRAEHLDSPGVNLL